MSKKGIDINVTSDQLHIFRERSVTQSEKRLDPDAKVMVETINIVFGEGEPEIIVNRVLCERT